MFAFNKLAWRTYVKKAKAAAAKGVLVGKMSKRPGEK
jgi:hypothetical protein